MAEFDPSIPFTLAKARAMGIPRWRLDGPGYQRVFTNVYVAADVELTAWVRGLAALILGPRGAALSHHSAAAVLGGIVPHSPLTHVSLPQGLRMRVEGIRAHRRSAPLDAVTYRSLPVTTSAQTFLDLAGCLDLVDLVVLGDSLVQAGVTTPEVLVGAAADCRGRGALLARRAAGLVRIGAESPMETRLRLLLVLAGLPEPVLQHEVHTSRGTRRLDLAWPEVQVAVEYDGRHHIERENQWHGDLGRREELEQDGWRFVVTVAHDIYSTPGDTISRVVAALRTAGMHVRATSGEWRRHFPGRAPSPHL